MDFDKVYIYDQEKHRRDFWIDFLKKGNNKILLKINDDGSLSIKGHFTITPYELYNHRLEGNNNAFEIEHLPFKFKKVTGKFVITGLKLTTLEGSPDECANFFANHNALDTLEGGPKFVLGLYSVNNCKLRSLQGAPAECSYLDCSQNNLISLEGCPQKLDSLDCSKNKLDNLVGAPKAIRLLNCSENRLTTLQGCPEFVESVPPLKPISINDSPTNESSFTLSVGMFDSNAKSLNSFGGIRNLPSNVNKNFKATSRHFYGIQNYIEGRKTESEETKEFYKDDFEDF